jgi:hypothetical protein
MPCPSCPECGTPTSLVRLSMPPPRTWRHSRVGAGAGGERAHDRHLERQVGWFVRYNTVGPGHIAVPSPKPAVISLRNIDYTDNQRYPTWCQVYIARKLKVEVIQGWLCQTRQPFARRRGRRHNASTRVVWKYAVCSRTLLQIHTKCGACGGAMIFLPTVITV